MPIPTLPVDRETSPLPLTDHNAFATELVKSTDVIVPSKIFAPVTELFTKLKIPVLPSVASPESTRSVATFVPSPTKILAELKTEVNFAVNVEKSELAKYPFTEAVARVISMDGDVVELLTVIGLPAVDAAVTLPIVPLQMFTPFTL